MATKGKVTYKQFVTKYNDTEDKIEFCKSHIINNYIDYQTKLSEVNRIADLGNHSSILFLDDNANEKQGYLRNTPVMYFLLKMKLLECYTDINIKEGEDLQVYNALEEIGAIDALISSIPESEVAKWNSMLQMVNDDIYINERDLVSYLDTKVDALSVVLDTMLSGLETVVNKLELAQNED